MRKFIDRIYHAFSPRLWIVLKLFGLFGLGKFLQAACGLGISRQGCTLGKVPGLLAYSSSCYAGFKFTVISPKPLMRVVRACSSIITTNKSITWVLAARPLAQSKAKAPGEGIVFSRRGIVYLRQARLTSLTGISNSVNLLLVGVCGSLAIFFTQ